MNKLIYKVKKYLFKIFYMRKVKNVDADFSKMFEGVTEEQLKNNITLLDTAKNKKDNHEIKGESFS